MEIISAHPVKLDSAAMNQPALRPPRAPWYLLLLWLGLFSWGYLFVAQPLLKENTMLAASDHEFKVLQATGDQTKILHSQTPVSFNQGYYRWFPHATLEGVPPLYPWLLAHTANSEGKLAIMPDVYVQGQRLNVWIGLSFLLLMGIWLWQKGSLLVAANTMLLLGGSVFLPHAVFYEPTVLFFCCYGMAFLLALLLLTRNAAWPHVGFGLILGLGYLTDLTIMPLVATWALVTTGRFIFHLFKREPNQSWNCPGHFIGLLGMAFALFAVIAPNLQFHHEKGHAWAPLQQEYGMVETESEDKKITLSEEFAAHPWKEELPQRWLLKLRSLLVPAPLQDASLEGAMRIFPMRGIYLWVLLGIFFIAAIHARTRGPAWFQDGPAADHQAGARVGFVLLTVGFGLLNAAIYHGRDGAERNVLHLYLVLVLSLVLAMEALRQWAERRGGGGRIYTVLYRVAHVALMAHLLYSVVAFLPKQG